MTNLEMLAWGLEHIAHNHGFHTNKEAFENGEDPNLCIWGGSNVPTQSDVNMLCEDYKIPRDCIDSTEFGVDVYFPGESEEEFKAWANAEYEKPVHEFWRRLV